ncbi:cbb3-type cytochrome oxidase assembly protein CcoS [Vibrio atlanticus]|uniref:cbb3-type cytochrome oxidase assembly protein CcoS n=1 Tax=Vibrio cyclitrophicus TaxID=47951 RepID=UPI00031DF182|nr:cbb3-type cytochrome oxidase assembly protein CcoS [Vibrio cyclitrophicus]MBY7660302.1 cbb3-type cytochrome oxidase assembly protein CcoS [Vibrio atlanticus]KAA8597346.1 Type cbb3 cytochrome oxidase biogenesis protein CcoS involved in heme b insertion [Vibrio cyclitrophicus]NOH18677.1 cbb3-type cytochrome oxidase assembly protein CcoS [Vibrio cyclitrophicus]OCH49747.1 cytochrome oxidase maturation protein, cbb3-type [Vibrio cyclitrophicus]PMF24971.1 cytochrome oxidase maturation protein, cb
MESLYILIPIAIVLVCIAVGIFLWAVKSEQFEDLERQGHNILFDEDSHAHNNSDSKPVVKRKAEVITLTSEKNHVDLEIQTDLEKKNDDA